MNEDFQLLTAYARDRDSSAFQHLVQKHIQFVYAAAFRQTGNRQMAEDILQAVFLLLSQRAAQLKPGTLVKGWLFHATRYAAQNAKRAEIRRKKREREVAAMRPQTTPEQQSRDIQPHLDDALSHLCTKDRNALIMRYFEDMPMVAVGQMMGISEYAAKKRVGRALNRLKDILHGRGIEVAGNSLVVGLSLGITEIIPQHLVQTTIDLVVRGASHASPAIPLAKGASKMMTQMRLKVLVMKLVLAAACMGTAAAVIVQQSHSAPAPAPRAVIALADPAADARDADAQVAELQYQACRQVFTSLLDAYDHNDAAAVQSQLYFAPDADPQLIKIIPPLIDVDLAVYRLQKATVARFGVRAIGLNYYMSTIINPVIELLGRINQKDCQFSGDTMTLNPPAPFMSHNGSWPQAPMYFKEVNGQWKLDVGRTIRLQIHFSRRIPVPGETPLQTFAVCAKIFADGFNNISDDVEHGKIDDVGDVQKRMDGQIIGISMQFSQFNIDPVQPK